MQYALCKERQHSQKQEFFVIMVLLKLSGFLTGFLEAAQ
jgi:hypothetical protein